MENGEGKVSRGESGYLTIRPYKLMDTIEYVLKIILEKYLIVAYLIYLVIGYIIYYVDVGEFLLFVS